MRLVIDLQGAQSASRFRGIGRSSMALATGIARQAEGHEVFIVLNGIFSETIESIKKTLQKIIPAQNICVWQATSPVCAAAKDNVWRKESAEYQREAFIANLRPDVLFITSLFEGYADDAVTSVKKLPSPYKTVVLLHDLIPLIYPENYLHTSDRKIFYEEKIEALLKADLLLSVSESSRMEAMEKLDISGDNIVTISSAADPIFKRTETEQTWHILSAHGIDRPFLLYAPGVSDFRKNIEGLIRAFALLPAHIRHKRQLVLASRIPQTVRRPLEKLAAKCGLEHDAIVFTGYVDDENLAGLYSSTELYVFPSIHEGFGLPVLEAMGCGAPVIGSCTSSIPEVIGCGEALFNPHQPEDIARKIKEVLETPALHQRLRKHSATRALCFSWDKTAERAMGAMEKLFRKNPCIIKPEKLSSKRLKLAFVSPLPPAKSGIAAYSTELIPELSRYYDIEPVATQPQPTDLPGWSGTVRTPEWLLQNAEHMDRVLYQFGNSPLHSPMIQLLQQVPGTVVLHDFFLSDLKIFMAENAMLPGSVADELYASHGYPALKQLQQEDVSACKKSWPMNLDILQHARGVMVHSRHAIELAASFYGEKSRENFISLKHLRTPAEKTDRMETRIRLGFSPEDMIVCSFGFINPVKCIDKILNAWFQSSLAERPDCHLIFAGENHGGEYGRTLLKKIKEKGSEKQIRITGWLNEQDYRNYLSIADFAIQLRTSSRGETSGTVLDCMNHGLATIINAHGSMKELPENTVLMLQDVFLEKDLAHAMEMLASNENKRLELGSEAKKHTELHHNPASCALSCQLALESFYNRASTDLHATTKAIACCKTGRATGEDIRKTALSLARNFPPRPREKHLFLDVTATSSRDLKTGIERVTRAIMLELIQSPPPGFRTEPVYLHKEKGDWNYRHARSYTLSLIGHPQKNPNDDIAEIFAEDIILGLDISGEKLIEAEKQGLFKDYRNNGTRIFFIIYDLLPIRLPSCFPPGADSRHHDWLLATARMDGVIAISESVAKDFREWVAEQGEINQDLCIEWFHLGADTENSAPSTGLPENGEQILQSIENTPTFLMVGTLEPRKGHLQTIKAFEKLWEDGINARLVIIGQEGWPDLNRELRRTIPQIVRTIRKHPEINRRLLWLNRVSDTFLNKLYKAAACLIAASEGEGFGLPLIEAARHGLPLMVRDIPVFREIAGDQAFYFHGTEPADLSEAVIRWLELYNKKQHPASHGLEFRTWQSSAGMLKNIIIKESN
ncbi:glycosyltransferase [Desulfobotulus mexicanus]|uniref:Glycosyltransferase n=1 Tax=Desulfobotulus mexicanus TaxID=2586642 RepID=A0A5Q4VC64_9BACT|nr:glycosyltransferase [Desulfobotulus mexicanus]TYT75294.1 glycosyltransferase [Desulfobotulus mexicanus]